MTTEYTGWDNYTRKEHIHDPRKWLYVLPRSDYYYRYWKCKYCHQLLSSELCIIK